MNRLYWKIVLVEGVLLLLTIFAAMWVMDRWHRAVESQHQQDKNAAIELLRIGLRNDLPEEISIANLENIASHIFKGHVQIVASKESDGTTGSDEILFRQNGLRYKLVVPHPSGHKDNPRGFTFPVYEKYVGFLLFMAAALSLLAIPLARIVTKPLGILQQDMKRFATGELSHRSAVASKDEVGEVARDFNEMADSIQRLVRVGKEMTAHVSHELRSPLTRIDVARQLLEDQATEKQRELLDSMREETEGMDALIERILRLSRLELNESKPEPLSFTDIVGEAVRRNTCRAGAKRLHLTDNLPKNFPGVGVREDLACLVDNLLTNALKFSPADGDIAVTLQEASGTVRLRVSNDAPQPDTDPTRLTEPFQRGRASEAVPGSGLGLAIAKRIVENHRGVIAVSWLDGKFCVDIRLPQDA